MRKSREMRVGVDHSLYSWRNLLERCFNKLKNARRVATRYDKTAESFLGFIDITSIRLWLRLLSTWPSVSKFSRLPVARIRCDALARSAMLRPSWRLSQTIDARSIS